MAGCLESLATSRERPGNTDTETPEMCLTASVEREKQQEEEEQGTKEEDKNKHGDTYPTTAARPLAGHASQPSNERDVCGIWGVGFDWTPAKLSDLKSI